MSNDPDQGDDDDARPEGSVARAIAGYQNGDADALGEMIKSYFDRLLTKARAKLGNFPYTDHEGLVQSTLRSFLKGARNGQYPAMNHRDELIAAARHHHAAQGRAPGQGPDDRNRRRRPRPE